MLLLSCSNKTHPSARPKHTGASVIEVLVDRGGGEDDARFAALAPGDTVEVRLTGFDRRLTGVLPAPYGFWAG